MEEIDHDRTWEIVCPACGYKHSDSWEYTDDEGKIDCDCGATFYYRRDVSIDYSTWIKETPAPGAGKGEK